MKFKKCSILIITLCLLCLPKSVFAEDIATGAISCPPENINVSVCDSGECDVQDLGEFLRELSNINSSCYINKVNINIKNGYYIVNYDYISDFNNITIKGEDKNKTTLVFDEVLEIYGMRNVTLNNVEIDAKNSKIGVLFDFIDKARVDNVVVNDASQFGVFNDRCDYADSPSPSLPNALEDEPIAAHIAYYRNLVEITNSDISNNNCGIFDGCVRLPGAVGQNNSDASSYNLPEIVDFSELKIEPYASTIGREMVEYPYDTTVISNSKISCAVAYGMDDYYIPPSIYVDASNTWTEKPVYGDNVIESGVGRVIVDLEEEKSVTLKSKDQLELNSVFPDVSDLEWTVEDETIAMVKDGKIVPLKVGKTVLSATNGGVNYRINLIVDNSLLNNPKTFNISYVLVLLIVCGLFGSMIYKKHYSK